MFIFLTRLRFPSKLSIAEPLRKRYGDRTLSLVFIFLTRLRFTANLSIAEVLRKRYGDRILKLVRKFEKTYIKHKKALLDFQFLKICEDHHVI